MPRINHPLLTPLSGWGLSAKTPASKGATGPTTLVMSDITSLITSLPTHPAAAFFLMGHSMGGCECLTYAAVGPAPIRASIRGYLAESPWISLDPKAQPSSLLRLVGRAAGKVMPKRQLVQKLDATTISRDPEVQQMFIDDPLCHNTGTLEGFAGMLDRAAALLEGTTVVREGSFWVGHGTGDRVCAYEGTRRWFEGLKVEDKEMKSYDGWYHRCEFSGGAECAVLD